MSVQRSALLAAALIMGTTVVSPPTMAVNPEAQRTESESLQATESGELVAQVGLLNSIFGRRRSRSDFDRFYLRNCQYRFSLEECYRLYEYERQGVYDRRRRVYDGRRRGGQVRTLRRRLNRKNQIIKQRDRRIDRLEDRLRKRNKYDRRRRYRIYRSRGDDD